jgi:hypothetical protein
MKDRGTAWWAAEAAPVDRIPRREVRQAWHEGDVVISVEFVHFVLDKGWVVSVFCCDV